MRLEHLFHKNRFSLALLIDPEKVEMPSFEEMLALLPFNAPDVVLLGGSSVFNVDLDLIIRRIRLKCRAPIVLFPGGGEQLSPEADGILMSSLISGRNPEFLIDLHVRNALKISALNIPVWPLGYILIEGHAKSSISAYTNTRPLPVKDRKQIIQTALAGELLGMHAIYLEAGSGAANAISPDIISDVSKILNCPLIVGGGIRTEEGMLKAAEAGASMVVIGTAIEESPNLLPDFVNAAKQFCFA